MAILHLRQCLLEISDQIVGLFHADAELHQAISVRRGAAGLIQASGTNAPGGNTSDPTVRVRLFGAPGFSGQANGLKVAHFLYNFAVDGGASCTPANSDTIPANAVVFGGAVNPTTAVTAAGAATVAIGTSAGSAGNSILTATGKASLSADAILVPTCVATPFKMSAAGQITITVATGPLTAGVIGDAAVLVWAAGGVTIAAAAGLAALLAGTVGR